jgi:hypothetical protein
VGAPLGCKLPILDSVTDRKESASTSQLRFPASLPGFDPKLVPSVAGSLSAISSIAVIDEAALKKAAETFQSFQPIVAPQIAEALAKMTVTAVPSKTIQAVRAPFNFAKTLENVDLTAMTGVRVAESLQTLDISKMFKINLDDLPPTVTADLASQFDRTAQEAVALAEVDEVASGVEDAVGVQLKNMTPAKRRELALQVVALIAGFVLLAAWLTQKDPKNPAEGVGHFLTCAAAYIYVYWRLIGKIDE